MEVTRLVEVTSTPEPTPPPTAPPPIILQEDFEAGAGEWYITSSRDGKVMVVDGVLRVTVRYANYMFATGHPDLDYLNAPFDPTVTLTNEAGPRDAFAAIGFRSIDEGNYAAFAIDGDGFYTLGVTVDGSDYGIIPWTRPTPAPRPPYVVRLVDSGKRVRAYLNEAFLFDIPFEYVGLGGVFFFVGTFDEALLLGLSTTSK